MTKTHLFVNKIILIGFIPLMLFIPLHTHAKPLTGMINKEGVNVRTDSTVSAESIGILKKRDNVKIIRDRFNWYKIILPYRFVCYASSDYLRKIGINSVRVKATTLNLRIRPSLDSAIIGKVKKGTILHLIKERNNWMKIKGFPYLYGWVHKKFINLLPDKTINNSSVQDNKKNKALEARNNKNSPDRKRIENYDYFAVEGTIHKLKQIENCPANYKLENKFTTFFLKIPDTYNADNFLKKMVTVKGRRIYDGCSYIYIEEISLSK